HAVKDRTRTSYCGRQGSKIDPLLRPSEVDTRPLLLERGSKSMLHKGSPDSASPLLTRAPAVTPSVLERRSNSKAPGERSTPSTRRGVHLGVAGGLGGATG